MSKVNKALMGAAVAVCVALVGNPAHAQTALSSDMDQIDKTLDLFFVAQNSNLYETIYPFSTAIQTTGVSSRPAVAPMSGIAMLRQHDLWCPRSVLRDHGLETDVSTANADTGVIAAPRQLAGLDV